MSSIVARTATAVTLTLALCLAGTTAPGSATPASAPRPSTTARVVAHDAHGTLRSHLKGVTSSGQKVTGTFTPLRVVKKHGRVQVRGLVQGVVHRAGGRTTFAALRSVPLSAVNGVSVTKKADARAALQDRASCSVLHLTLGPLDLNLLGLTVHLNQVVLNIDSVPGAGNLLGNLLCAVAGLLDGGGLLGQLGQLSSLLNQILGLLDLSA